MLHSLYLVHDTSVIYYSKILMCFLCLFIFCISIIVPLTPVVAFVLIACNSTHFVHHISSLISGMET